ncbi:hypothetical protein K504DRAFT_473583 [Pleomassaria siparia CBS 279.74]|uniref:Zn(2)-C6 fungal-type domain-containing protein n=1 Tax=Pleomassaria siparia CBS 279.74 TaxID=1314801 RepID=A0A6G1JUF7_9PLEO|nr:hypothetical protein K504DRAFT_473583 [Pleomassaria siparia CBS 279.74]
MLGYISSTRKKSCHSCVKSKRRCDLGYPCCRRCLAKKIDCTYPNASVHEAKVMIRHTTPDLAPLAVATTELWQDQNSAPGSIDPALLQPSESSNSSESAQEVIVHEQHQRGITCVEPRMCDEITQMWEPSYLTKDQVRFIVNKLCSFIPSMASAGNTPFTHEALYRDYSPPAYQDSCSLSALYLMRTDKNIPILTKSIDSKIACLLTSSSHWTLSEHLAAVQALIIYQIIRLFDPALGLQAIAEKQNYLLELWTAYLWKRSFNDPGVFTSCYDSWVFYESLRRTTIMSVFIRGTWNALTSGGFCDQVPVLARLPLSKDGQLWHGDLHQWTEKEPCATQCLQTYGEFSTAWQSGSPPDQLTDFERLLLVACRGKEEPALLIN